MWNSPITAYDYFKTHNILDMIKREIKQIESFTVSIEPYKPRIQRVVIPIESDLGLNSPVMEHFGRANYFILINLEEDKILSCY